MKLQFKKEYTNKYFALLTSCILFLGGVASSSDGLFDHPTEDITIAGEAIQPLPSTFHGLLQTVSDLMLLLPVGSSLQVFCYIIVFLKLLILFLCSLFIFSYFYSKLP